MAGERKRVLRDDRTIKKERKGEAGYYEKNFAKTIDKMLFAWYNMCRNKEKFRFHPAAKRARLIFKSLME